MKTLLLLRHAKSIVGSLAVPDFVRPLDERGTIEAELIGKFIGQQGPRLDLILCSPAVRTRETLAIVTTTAGLNFELRFDERIYEAGLSALIDVITELDSNKDAIMLVGHNPGVEILIERLTGRAGQMPTGTLANFLIKALSWTSAFDQPGELQWLVKPNELRSP